MWKMLRRVEIPTFAGDKQQYEGWKAAFSACIDQAPATAEFKLLQLRQYLKGDALKLIEHLGHSATAYDAAKDRLEREYGGRRRQVALYLEELDNFPPVRDGNAKELKRFANLLDIAVINLEEAGKQSELSDGLLYARLQQKLSEQMVTQYRRWLFEKGNRESVKTLREWVLLESEFRTEAAEIRHGVAGSHEKSKKDFRARSFLGEHQQAETQHEKVKQSQLRRKCSVCSEIHELWKCPGFKKMSSQSRWKLAQEAKACFRCLARGHLSQSCQWGRQKPSHHQRVSASSPVQPTRSRW
jgi:hypothetical protein